MPTSLIVMWNNKKKRKEKERCLWWGTVSLFIDLLPLPRLVWRQQHGMYVPGCFWGGGCVLVSHGSLALLSRVLVLCFPSFLQHGLEKNIKLKSNGKAELVFDCWG